MRNRRSLISVITGLAYKSRGDPVKQNPKRNQAKCVRTYTEYTCAFIRCRCSYYCYSDPRDTAPLTHYKHCVCYTERCDFEYRWQDCFGRFESLLPSLDAPRQLLW